MNKKPEASKIIILANYIIGVLLLAITVITNFLGKDTMIMGTITGLVWTEIGAATAFYFAKATSENKIKIALGTIKELRSKEIGVNVEDINLPNLLDSITK